MPLVSFPFLISCCYWPYIALMLQSKDHLILAVPVWLRSKQQAVLEFACLDHILPVKHPLPSAMFQKKSQFSLAAESLVWLPPGWTFAAGHSLLSFFIFTLLFPQIVAAVSNYRLTDQLYLLSWKYIKRIYYSLGVSFCISMLKPCELHENKKHYVLIIP